MSAALLCLVSIIAGAWAQGAFPLTREATVQFSRGRLQALACSQSLIAGTHGDHENLILWDMEGRTLQSMPCDRCSEELVDLCFSRDGDLLAAGPRKGYVRIYAPLGAKGEPLSWFEGTSSLAFSPRKSHLAVGGRDGGIKLWDLSNRRVSQIILAHDYFVSALVFSPDGSLLASGSWDRTVKLWAAGRGAHRMTLTQGGSPPVLMPSFPGMKKSGGELTKDQPVTSLAFSADGVLIAAGTQCGSIFIWNTASGERMKKIEGHSCAALSLSFSGHGEYLACGFEDGSLGIADGAGDWAYSRTAAHDNSLCVLRFSDEGSRLFTFSRGGTLIKWKVPPRP